MNVREARSNTSIWVIDPSSDVDAMEVKEAGAMLASGRLVAFPTETVYGLGADARNTDAVTRIFQAKGRPSDNPLIVHLHNVSQVESIAEHIPPLAHRLMERFWPGPLTVVVPVKPGIISERVTAGLNTVALRIPNHPVALALLREAGCPVAAPSANLSGRPSPTEASHVIHDLEGKIDGVVDGGPAQVGLESTVVEVRGDHIIVLRPGGITLDQLNDVSDNVTMEGAEASAPRSPGMKYRHYAPQGALTLVQGEAGERVQWIQRQIDEAKARGKLTGVLAFAEHEALYEADLVLSLGSKSHPEQAAHLLFRRLRKLDEHQIDYIWVESPSETGIGVALLNRLVKAAEGNVVRI